jgi:hypothetical protein
MTDGYKILEGIMILFPALTARLTQNMELGCIKNIYGNVGCTWEWKSIYQGTVTTQRASQISRLTDTDCTLLSLIFTTKQKRFIASVTLQLKFLLRRTYIYVKHYFVMEKQTWIIILAKNLQGGLLFLSITYIIKGILCLTAWNLCG